ncbi:MAG: hypothetical protein WBW44_09260, partial [Solirubrobacterales bacterium]
MRVFVVVFAVVVYLFLVDGVVTAGTASGAGWKEMPVVPKLSGSTAARLARDVASSRAAGNRRQVFMKVGDSNTEMAGVLYGLGCRQPKVGSRIGRAGLQATIRRYNQIELSDDLSFEGCDRITSFSRRSNAVRSGSWSTWSLELSGAFVGSSWEVSSQCRPKETPLACEVRMIKPVFALVMTGTNDIPFDLAFGIDPGTQTRERISALVKSIRDLGSVPVLSTLPPAIRSGTSENRILRINALITAVA